jgi:hypothetical protein
VPTNLLDAFTAWAGHHGDLEPDVAHTLVDLKATFLGDSQPGRWRAGDLSAVLLEWIPCKVSADDAWYSSVLPTTRAFLEFAHGRGLLHRGSDPLDLLLRELDDVEEEFASAVRDPSRFGLAKSVLGGLGVLGDVGGLDLDDPGFPRAAIERFNGLPFDERRRLTDPASGAFGPADRGTGDLRDEDAGALPPVRLAPLPELAAAVRTSATVAELLVLGNWLGAGRTVTGTGVLRIADAVSACEQLGWPPVPDRFAEQVEALDGPPAAVRVATLPTSPPGADEPAPPAPDPRMRSAKEIDRLQRLWALALEAEWVVVKGKRASRGPAWERYHAADDTGDDAAVVQVWTRLFEAMTELGVDAGEERRNGVLAGEVVDELLPHALLSAYIGEPHTLDQLLEEGLDRFDAVLTQTTDTWWRGITAGTLGRGLRRLADLGAVATADDVVRLTPLGTHGMRELLLASGADAPALGDVREMDAARLLRDAGALSEDDLDAAFAEWLEVRTPEAAVVELLDAARAGPALVRSAVLSLFDKHLAVEAASALQQVTTEPLLGPLARIWLAGAGARPDPALAPAELQLIVVETMAAVLSGLAPPVRTDDLPEDAWTLVDELDLTTAWRLEHPELLDVLDAVASGHPAGRVRKAAKKAAHKARLAGHV